MLSPRQNELPLRVPTIQPPPHSKALLNHPDYLAAGFTRISVPEGKVAWDVAWPEYEAIPQNKFDHPVVIKQFESKGEAGWAAAPTARALAGITKSYVSNLPVNAAGEVLNPGGRTGIKDGRGLLGKPGPNFAADPIIFRIDPVSRDLQILLIQRKDTSEWALPGGMTDFGEMATATLQRELQEETGLVLNMADSTVVYKGYVDDPRNTDKAWMETIAAMKLLTPIEARQATIKAGSDAKAARWKKIDSELLSNLYASHAHFIKLALEQLPVMYATQVQGVVAQILAARGERVH